MVSYTPDDCLQRQIAQKIFKYKIEACPVNAGHYLAFKHSISFTINWAANLGCNWFRIVPDIVSKHLLTTIWSSCADQFESEQTHFPWSGQSGCISFATHWAANFGCYQISFPSFCAQPCEPLWSHCAGQFESEQMPFPLTLAELHISILTSFIRLNKALTKFNEASTKPCHGLVEILL